MMSYSKLYPTERKIKTSSNMHIMGTKTFRNTIICKLIDTDNKGIFVGYFKGITQMITMRMRKNNIISSDVLRFNRRSRIIIQKGINEYFNTFISSYLESRMREIF